MSAVINVFCQPTPVLGMIGGSSAQMLLVNLAFNNGLSIPTGAAAVGSVGDIWNSVSGGEIKTGIVDSLGAPVPGVFVDTLGMMNNEEFAGTGAVLERGILPSEGVSSVPLGSLPLGTYDFYFYSPLSLNVSLFVPAIYDGAVATYGFDNGGTPIGEPFIEWTNYVKFENVFCSGDVYFVADRISAIQIFKKS